MIGGRMVPVSPGVLAAKAAVMDALQAAQEEHQFSDWEVLALLAQLAGNAAGAMKLTGSPSGTVEGTLAVNLLEGKKMARAGLAMGGVQ